MTKLNLLWIVNQMRLVLLKYDTHYQKTIPIDIQVLCAIYKLAHGANFLVCNELFAIGKSTVSKVLHEFVIAMNFVFKKLIASPIRIEMAIVMENFKQWCGLLNVHGAIDNTHIIIYKPITLFPEDYYHHKLVTIPYRFKQWLILTNFFWNFMWDFQVVSTMLKSCVGLHCIVMLYIIIYLILAKVWREFFLICLGDKGYPLINQIMTSFKEDGQHSIFELLYNR